MNLEMSRFDVDVSILGGGMAGISAAISAAKAGCRTLIVERRTSLGGLATTGMVMPFLGVYGGGHKVISGNLDLILAAIGKHFPTSVNKHAFDPEAMRHTLDILMDDYKIDLLLDTWATDICVENEKITKVAVHNKSGHGYIRAKEFIDTTGDADVANMAGISCTKGRESDGKTQAYTLRFMLGHVNTELAQPWLDARDKKSSFIELLNVYATKYNVPILDMHFQNFQVPGRNDVLVFNVPRIIDIDGTNGFSLSDGYRLARRLIRVYMQIMRENVPGCEQAYLMSTAESLGVRESRRIIGEYVLTGDDVARGRKFPDAICGNCWWIDIHNPSGKGVSEMIAPKGGHNDIPYRALYNRKIDNLWVAGRCISTTHEALASTRIMPTCIATGQAAGIAASIADKQNLTASSVAVTELQNRLVAEGSLITGINLDDSIA